MGRLRADVRGRFVVPNAGGMQSWIVFLHIFEISLSQVGRLSIEKMSKIHLK
jgi:hypothetical protein